MKIGVMMGGNGTDEIIEKAIDIEARGFDSLWMGNFPGYRLETMHAMGLIARETNRIRLGTAIIPIHLHHPLALAHQAVSIQETSNGRFTLGVGLSHPFVVNDWLGLSYKRPAAQMREYLSILAPLLAEKAATTQGAFFRANAKLQGPDVSPVPLLVAAMGPQMLKAAGTMTNGTVTFLTGLRTLESHIIPRIRSAADDAGRPNPKVVVGGLPMALVQDKAAALATIAKQWASYSNFPTYRAMFEREGANGAADVAIVGDEGTLKATLQRLEALGVTEFIASPVAVESDTVERTLDFMASQL